MKTSPLLTRSTFRILCLLVCSACFVSCESDDDNAQAGQQDAGMAGTDAEMASTDAEMTGMDDAAASDDSGAATDAGPTPDATPAPTNPRQRALHSIATNVYLATYTRFKTTAETLVSAVNEWSDDPTPETKEAAQAAWLNANQVWQQAELMQVGPAGVEGRRIGGADLRDKIYSYPERNACRVDQVLVSQAYTADNWVDGAYFNLQGLDALEYLLYNDTLENQCPAAVSLNRTGQWAPLAADADELWSRRTNLAKVLSDQLVVHATTLVETWTEGSEFSQAFINGEAPFGDVKTSLDQVFAGMFYVDKFIKDLKLGKPAGITPDCEADVCPSALESKHARVSKENLLANLEGFRLLMHGGADDSAYGFDDLLEEEGAGELATTLIGKLQGANDALNSISGTLADALANTPESVRGAHAAVKALTDDLKTQFVTVLNLSVPQEGAGDND